MNIDDFIGMAKDVVDTVAKKTEDVVEVSKMKLETVRINNQLTCLYEELGRCVYQAEKRACKDDGISQEIQDEIKEALAKLDELTKEIADKKNNVFCCKCGAVNEKENCYCGKCGAKLVKEPVDAQGFEHNDTVEADETVASDDSNDKN